MEDDDEDARVVAAAPGPICVSLAELPLITFDGVVLANELLDNLPFRVFEGEAEVLVGERDGRFVELTVPAGSPLGPAVTGRHPVQTAATDWLRQALSLVRRGRVCVIDYGADTATLAERGGWLRTYRAHARGGDPLDAPGTQDITADVCVDQLAAVRPPTTDRSQAEFLRALMHYATLRKRANLWAPFDQSLEFIKRNFIDAEYGGWYGAYDPKASKEGRRTYKGSVWMVGYHVSGMYAEALRLSRKR